MGIKKYLVVCLAIISIIADRSVDGGTVPDFRSILERIANVSASTPDNEIVSKVNTNTLFNDTEFLIAMARIGFLQPDIIQSLSTIKLKDGATAFQVTPILEQLVKASNSTTTSSNLRDQILLTMNLSTWTKKIDYKQLLLNPYVKEMLPKTIPPMALTILMSALNVDGIFGTVNLEPIIKYQLIGEPRTKSYQDILLENIDFNNMVRQLQLHKLFNNPFVDTLLKSFGVPDQMLQILKTLDFSNLPNIINVTEIVAAAFDYDEANSKKFMTDLINAIDFSHLQSIVNVNKLVDAVLNISSVYNALEKSGIDPSFLKSILDDINLGDALKIVDIKGIFKALNTNKTTFEKLLKIMETINLNKLLPDIKLRDILKLPTVAALLNQTGLEPELLITIIESVDLNEAIKAFNFTNLNLFDFLNTTKLVDILIKSTDFNVLIKSIDVDKLFAHPMVTDFVKKQFNINPMVIKVLLKSVDVDKLIKAVDTKKITEVIFSMMGQGNMKILKQIEAMLDFNKLIETIDFDRFLRSDRVKDFLKKANVDPVILELISTIGINNLLKQINIGKLIQNALLSPNGISFNTVIQQIMKNVDLSKLLSGLDWKKIIDGAKTGKITSDLWSIGCLQDMGSMIGDLNTSSINLMQLMNDPRLQMLDANGKPGARFLLGNSYWMGAFDECNMVSNAKYCISQFKVVGRTGMFGACMPKQCNEKDVKNMVDIFFLMTSLLGQPGIIKVPDTPEDYRMTKPVMCDNGKEYTTGYSITLVICAIFVTLCLLGTLVEHYQDFIVGKLTSKSPVKSASTNVEFNDLSTSTSTTDLTPYDGNTENNDTRVEVETENPKKGHAIVNFFTCFSIRRNICEILSTDAPKGAIGSINGIRTISMFWVIIGHVYMLIATFPVDNIRSVFEDVILDNYAFLAILDATVSVDTFFLLSGLLVSYLTLKRMDKQKGKINIIMFYVHRFIRITPVYMFVILFWTNVMPHLLKGPVKVLSMFDDYADNCKGYWWANLLYINNFHPRDNMCLPWSWYLANDMQFYIVAPGVLYLIYLAEQKMQGSRLRALPAFVITGALTLLSIIITAAIISGYNLLTLNFEERVPGNPRSKTAGDYNFMVYKKPYTRIAPYLIGILLGYIFSRDLKFSHSRKYIFNIVGWVVAFLIGYSVVYGPSKTFKKDPTFLTDGEQAMYGAFSRPAWAIAVAWVIYACENKAGGFINSFLSWKAWIPLGRLTFCAYLIHPFIIGHFFAAYDNPLHYQNNVFAYHMVAVTFVTYFCSFILAVFMEFPLTNVEKMLFKK